MSVQSRVRMLETEHGAGGVVNIEVTYSESKDDAICDAKQDEYCRANGISDYERERIFWIFLITDFSN